MPESESPIPFRRRAWSLIRPYWKSEERWPARGLLLAIIALSLGTVYLDVQLNGWRKDFYDSLQNLDKAAFYQSIMRFSYLVTIYIVAVVYYTYLSQMLRIRWRRWMTKDYLDAWLGRQNHYRMQLFADGMDNPDQRISEDIDQFIQMSIDLPLGALNSIVTLFSFLFILWEISGPLDFTLHGAAIHIPAYMVWVAFIYALLGTWLTFHIGRPLIKLNYDKQHYEADFRFSLARLRENTESIAFYHGEAQENENFISRFNFIFDNWRQIMRRQRKLNWLVNGYGQVAEIFPFVVASPRYFAKLIKLGDLMQIASAFGQVQGALSYLINQFASGAGGTAVSTVGIANWKAVSDRLSSFNRSVERAEAMSEHALKPRMSSESIVKADDLTLNLPDGRTLLRHVTLTLRPGGTLLITGRSGCGKSTLLRALAGLWPFVQGEIILPHSARMLFVPQKPYLPLGTLAAALCYPQASDAVPEEEMRAVMELCGLGELASRLGETDQWSNLLSLGEQQRVAFARVLLAKPDFVFLDEATSALDEASESQLYALLRQRLPETAVASVGHRASLRAFHAAEMAL